MKNLSILGSSGSIGTQTLDIVSKYPQEFCIKGLTVNQNIELLQKQIEVFKPEVVAVNDEEKAEQIESKVSCTVYKGMEGVNKVATLDSADTVVNSLVGSIGVEPTYNAINAKKNIALANKETLVAAGSVIMEAVKKNDVILMPIDSEHSAIFQCLNGERRQEVRKIILTCSGGPFRTKTKQELASVTKADALKHPNWEMGAKITVDSATLMNKGFEVIEAHWLYTMDYTDIEVVIHPQSVVHSMVEFVDHSFIAQLGFPDMKVPIQYALTYPKRLPTSLPDLQWHKVKQLNFEGVDYDRFPCLQYAYEAGAKGGLFPVVLNAANEVAVKAFLEEKITYSDIAPFIKKTLDSTKQVSNPSLKEILKVDREIKQQSTP